MPVNGKFGHNVWVLDPMAQFLHLVAHLEMTYGSEDLIRWYDIYRLVKGNLANLDWEQLLDVGKNWRPYLPFKKYCRNYHKSGEYQFRNPLLQKQTSYSRLAEKNANPAAIGLMNPITWRLL